MAKNETLLEVEIDGANNEQLYFAPIQRRIRGRFDFGRVAEPQAKLLTNKYPLPIPGQRLSLDTATGEAAIVEPLHEAEHARTRRIIEKGKAIAPERESLGIAHVPTWLFWIKRAVEAGLARVTKGTLPATIEGEPQRSFFSQSAKNTDDRLAAALEANTAVMREMLAQLIRAK